MASSSLPDNDQERHDQSDIQEETRTVRYNNNQCMSASAGTDDSTAMSCGNESSSSYCKNNVEEVHSSTTSQSLRNFSGTSSVAFDETMFDDEFKDDYVDKEQSQSKSQQHSHEAPDKKVKFPIATRRTSSSRSMTVNENGENEGDLDTPLAEEITRESRAINYLKILVISMLIITAVTVTALTFHFLREEENDDFRTQYHDFGSKILESFNHHIDMKIFTAITISSSITSRHEGANWPNVTLPDFEEQLFGTRLVTHLITANFSPLVREKDKAGWERYATDVAVQHRSAHVPQLVNRTSPDARIVADGIFKIIQDDSDDDENVHLVDDVDRPSGLYLPLWQIAPMKDNEEGVMYNLYSNTKDRVAIDTMLQTKRFSVSDISYKENDYHRSHDTTNDAHQPLHYHQPTSTLYYPIFSSFEEETSEVLGSISFTFSWEESLKTSVPNNVGGLCLVFQSKAGGQAYTFKTMQNDVEFLGVGDLHESKYDYMEMSTTYVWCDPSADDDDDEMAPADGHGHGGNHSYEEGVHLRKRRRRRLNYDFMGGRHNHNHGGGCKNPVETDLMLRVYPTSQFNSSYITNKPTVMAGIAALIFFFTSATFLIYDCLVERRQTVVMQSAARSNRILHSLFPAVVRDRLIKNAEKEEKEAKVAEQQHQGGVSSSSIATHKEASITNILLSTSMKLKNHLIKDPLQKDNSQSDLTSSLLHPSPPIADLFSDTTILVANIAGFTAWSSEREPTQVFQLLEALYSEFDAEARRQSVFKVETNGDNYVAVVGLPDPRDDHALIMARFAQRCLVRFRELTKELELSLGPGTAKLGMRVGMHSGPVTAGVLRGDKKRFQLFGDTMNTAWQLESTGKKNKVQVSEETAELLKEAGFGHTLVRREEEISMLGKGKLQTYWLHPRIFTKSMSESMIHGGKEGGADGSSSLGCGRSTDSNQKKTNAEKKPTIATIDETESAHNLNDHPEQKLSRRDSLSSMKDEMINKESWTSWTNTGVGDDDTTREELQRLITWNASVLETHLQKILSQRKEAKLRSKRNGGKIFSLISEPTVPYIDELSDAVAMPRFDREAVSHVMHHGYKLPPLPEKARVELHNYVTRIASMYRRVHFHNFEHASHVTMSANKLMNKVCSPMLFNGCRGCNNNGKTTNDDKEYTTKTQENDFFFSTYGISIDPLAQFAIVFAALVHDVDHTGVPNVQLIKENEELGIKYKNRTVAEQNSIHIALSVLMEPKFENLRLCIYADEEGKRRFRQLLINVVVATDIADRDRMGKEKARWQQAFADLSSPEDLWRNKNDEKLAEIDVSLKATVVLEQIMLASDVAHTMQHWHTFVKWNERLFRELWAAFKAGRGTMDPRINWYKGQISFYDGYIIPLANKLKECGVFGSAGDEYLSFALKNRQEWTEKGERISAQFIESITKNGNGGLDKTPDEDAFEKPSR